MTRAWPPIVLLPPVFTGAWIVGRYSGDGGRAELHRPNALILRIAPNVFVQPTPHMAADELNRALRTRRPPVVVTVTTP